jgi:hypothetical protein
MAKNTTKKIKELKGIEDIRPEKITDEELTKLKTLVKDVNLMHHELGVFEGRKYQMLQLLTKQQTAISALQDDFKKEYGTLDIDINDGSIKYPENGETDKKD